MATKNENSIAGKVDCKNPDAQETGTPTLRLISSDGQEFLISESAAILSVVIKNIMEDDFCSGGVIPLMLVDGGTLARVITYLTKHAEEGLSDEEKGKFDKEFLSEEEIEVLFDVALAANYLNVRDLLEAVCKKIADRMVKQKREMGEENVLH
ncbi:SKP1-like protein 13 [Sesamum alatum]|uniref:SKP1-like protein n=1 Tax=Sesamum alatum TaxID=300844 RepID=A0AAE1YIM9_9LAMI|nr:SKP1-like protein 13 [Sesamum alatum]